MAEGRMEFPKRSIRQPSCLILLEETLGCLWWKTNSKISTPLTFDPLSSGSRHQSATQQAIRPGPAHFQSSPRLAVFLFGAKPLPRAAPLTSDPGDAGGTEEPATRPEDLRGAAEEPTQVESTAGTARCRFVVFGPGWTDDDCWLDLS